ncbi:response regulator [Labilibacter marinus]|uniref:response regulator n=1 Tax=Labilibacter marinus TaxID=1477105 RepID=UPI0008319553|nr:response regulator [Labilibacter marinus]
MFTPDPQKILIVDDSMSNIMMLKESLSDFNCIAATSGNQALLLAKQDKKPDLILLDIVMKGMDGYEVCMELKKDPLTLDIPVIFLSSQDDADSLVKGFNVGAVDFIGKPFHEDELTVRVNNQLKFKKSLDNNALYLKSIEDIYDTITDSMYYAQKIQQATLPHKDYMDRVLDEYFVFYKPRDIVSGDFYLVHEIDNKVLLVAADCTGHGVPGALMSMMSMALINEMINIENKYTPNEILNQLRYIIIDTFNAEGKDEITDGLDASIIVIDKAQNEAVFSGANSPLYLVRDGELIEYKGDRMPVGIYPTQTPFTKHKIELKENDCIYLSSDGYADQFGGESNRKMMLKPFKEVLASGSYLHMKEQEERINKHFSDWKGYNEQVDDVLVMGYRYKG